MWGIESGVWIHLRVCRLTKDVSSVDNQLPFLLVNFTSDLFALASSIITIAVLLPQFAPLVGVVCVIYFILQRLFRSNES